MQIHFGIFGSLINFINLDIEDFHSFFHSILSGTSFDAIKIFFNFRTNKTSRKFSWFEIMARSELCRSPHYRSHHAEPYETSFFPLDVLDWSQSRELCFIHL